MYVGSWSDCCPWIGTDDELEEDLASILHANLECCFFEIVRTCDRGQDEEDVLCTPAESWSVVPQKRMPTSMRKSRKELQSAS